MSKKKSSIGRVHAKMFSASSLITNYYRLDPSWFSGDEKISIDDGVNFGTAFSSVPVNVPWDGAGAAAVLNYDVDQGFYSSPYDENVYGGGYDAISDTHYIYVMIGVPPSHLTFAQTGIRVDLEPGPL